MITTTLHTIQFFFCLQSGWLGLLAGCSRKAFNSSCYFMLLAHDDDDVANVVITTLLQPGILFIFVFLSLALHVAAVNAYYSTAAEA